MLHGSWHSARAYQTTDLTRGTASVTIAGSIVIRLDARAVDRGIPLRRLPGVHIKTSS